MGPERAVILETDDYYREFGHLGPGELENLNFDHPDVFDLEQLLEHLKHIKNGHSISRPSYDLKTKSISSLTNFISLNKLR